ncbi:MAG TPA: DUF6789 family protein [Thermomicrobiales bacterium]|nr:DUF6789 family protein [Thermomicrobiales bacterium]
MNRLLAQGIAGASATGFMTLVIGAAKGLGLFENPPPAEITRRAAAKTDVSATVASRDQPGFGIAWMSAHVSFGTLSGILYAQIRPHLPDAPVPMGLLYGGAVWAVNYLGIMPALGLYPAPERDTRERTAVMIAAHAVYGVSLELLLQRIPGAVPRPDH